MSMCNMEQGTKTTPAVEVWRPVVGWEGLYEVSSHGRVRSLDRYVRFGINQRFVESHVLKPQPTPRGYLTVALCNVKRTVHRIVAEAFVHNPNNLPEINHKDENKLNNRADNLEWCDRLYNVNYGTGIQRRENPIEQLTLYGQHVAYYTSIKNAERHLGFDQSYITKVCRGKRNTAYGYQWRYV